MYSGYIFIFGIAFECEIRLKFSLVDDFTHHEKSIWLHFISFISYVNKQSEI